MNLNATLKILVSVFSFLFTFVGVVILFSVVTASVRGLFQRIDHPILAFTVDLVPLLIALPAAITAARVALRAEQQRQCKRSSND